MTVLRCGPIARTRLLIYIRPRMIEHPTFADVEAAARRIAPYVVETPILESALLNERVKGQVLIKAETLQRTGSFKLRGAVNRILQIPEAARPAGVVAFSSGNHAQGVAAAAALFGLRATIVMPADAPRAKIDGTRRLGAEIVFYDRAKDDREAIAIGICDERRATLVKPFDDPAIVAGQGTIGLEIAAAAKARGIVLDNVLVPAGGGGVVSGIALALSGQSPSTRVISVEPQRYDGMRRSLASGTRQAAPGGAPSIADALMSPMPGEIPFAVARRYLAGGLAVTDDALAAAISFAAQYLKLIVEPGGAAALAALLSGVFDAEGRKVAIVLTGGNADVSAIADAYRRIPDP